MASHSEIALVDTNDQPEPGKSRVRRTAKTLKSGDDTSSTKKTSKTVSDRQPAGTDVVPVMKLRAIDIIDEDKHKASGKEDSGAGNGDPSGVIHMPPPDSAKEGGGEARDPALKGNDNAPAGGAPGIALGANGEALVTDPELLELLEQLSATIDTAHTVLDAAAGVPGDGHNSATNGTGTGEQRPEPVPCPELESDGDDLPPLAARFQSEQTAEAVGRKTGIGFGLVANTALTGLVFAAGAAWLVHTNPWLLDRVTGAPSPVKQASPAVMQPSKDQTALPGRDVTTKRVAAVPGAALSSFTPPDEEPVPMEVVERPAETAPVADNGPARGPAGHPIALGIAIPASSGGPEMSVMVQGVPKEAKLSAGKDLGSGNWLLGETDLEGLELETAMGLKPGDYELEVILVKSDGSVPVTQKVAVDVQPASSAQAAAPSMKASAAGLVAAAPETTYARPGVAIEVASVPAESPAEKTSPVAAEPVLSPQEVRTILTRGDTLLEEGDVAGARLLLEYAAQRGSKDAMVKLARSYDPQHLAKLGVHGVKANPEKATHWYARAATAGAAQ